VHPKGVIERSATPFAAQGVPLTLYSLIFCSSVPREGTTMAWVWLTIAGLFEIGWVAGLKFSQGLSLAKPGLSALAIGLSIISFVLLGQAIKTLPVGTSYAVWTGIGAVGSAILGMILFGESRDPARIACIAMVIVGIVGLKLTAP
jgi:quaternary ammonium compound-resistance protein SugE